MAVDFIEQLKEAKSHKHPIVLWPRRWRLYDPPLQLRWKIVPFVRDSLTKLPKKPGVYAFLIQPRVANLAASYPMYIGETERHLRVRCQEYLQEAAKDQARPKILALLRMYRDFLYFSYAVVEGDIPPSIVEKRLLETFLPPANDDFPATVSRIVKAWG